MRAFTDGITLARRKGQDNLTNLLLLINGGLHPKKVPIIQAQKQIIEFLRNKPAQTCSRKELEELLNLKFSNAKDERVGKRNQDRFYNILSPLLKTMVEGDRKSLTYKLNPYYFDSFLDGIKRTARTIFKGE